MKIRLPIGIEGASDGRAPESYYRDSRLRVDKAFTLIEILVAIFVFMMVLASVYATWKLVTQGSRAALKTAADAQRTRMAIQVIDEALSSAMYSASNPQHYTVLADTSGPYGMLSFVSMLSDSFPGSGAFGGERLRRVSFYVDEGRHDLMIEQNSMLADMTQTEGQKMVLAHEVTAFQLEFWDPQQNDYVPEWLLTNQLPVIVRVTMGFGRGQGFRVQPREVVSRTIRLASVGVPLGAQGGLGIR